MIAVGLRNRCRAISDQGLARVREQFQYEYRPAEHAPLTVQHVTSILQGEDRKREENAVIVGFLLLLCLVYFISPLVVIGVIVAVILVTILTGDGSALRLVGLANDRAELRLEQSLLSFRAGDDGAAPPALRAARKQVLRDRARRYADVSTRLRHSQTRARRMQDAGFALAFALIFSAYAFPIAAGFETFSANLGDSLVTTSLFSVAPVIILLSISKSTVALAQVIGRRLPNLSR